jgi:putative tryptophan/tyrosine transport system substrate-binding protein
MRRIGLAVVVTLSLFAAPLAGEAQQAGTRRIGFLETSSPSPARVQLWEALRQRLRELGYLEGQNIAFESRFAEGKTDRLPGLAAELVALKVDVIVTSGTPASLAAKQATLTIPIVMAQLADPVGSGLVASLGRPGGNVTGLSTQDADLSGKRLGLLKEVVPKVSRIALLIDETNPGAVLIAKGTQAAAHSAGVQLQSLGVRDPGELDRAFSAMKEARAGALIVESSSMLFTSRTRLADLALKNRLPTMFAQREYAEGGGLMAYSADFLDLFRRTAAFVDKILKGAKPADLPIEQPTKFELVINLKTAKALGLTIPPSLLARADQMIE